MIIASMEYEDLTNKINQYLDVREREKDKYGEVFTPPVLINELLDELPKSIWSNPHLKWLDPASGIGNFFMLVFLRLMNGLSTKIPNKNKRSEHILTKMLYMIEINPKNVKISHTIFGKEANIICGDFLTHHYREGDAIKFDVIIGNLPFNEEKNENNKKTVALWPKFVVKSLELLNENGYLAFIHPQNWRSPDSKTRLWDILTHKHILYLHIYGEEESKKLFKVTTKVDLYIVKNDMRKNNKNGKNTIVIDELGYKHDINLTKYEFLPNYKIKEIKALLYADNNNKKITIIHDTFYSTTKTKETSNAIFKYPVISSITANNILHIRYSNTKEKGHFGVAKVIINGGRYPYPYNDYTGKYGMTQNLFAIPIVSKSQGESIVKALNSQSFQDILKASKWGTFAIDYKLFKQFKNDFYKPFLSTNSRKTRKISHRK